MRNILGIASIVCAGGLAATAWAFSPVTGFWRAPVPFDPSSIAGMTMWLEADDPATLFQGDLLNPVTANGQTVGSWVNKLNASDYCKAESGTITYAASGLNGHPAVDFPGSGSCKTLVNWSTYVTTTELTIFVVAVVDAAPTDAGYSTSQNSNALISGESAASLGLAVDSSPSAIVGYINSGGISYGAAGMTLGTANLFKGRHQSSRWYFGGGGGSFGGYSSSGATDNLNHKLRLGVNHGGTLFFDGRIAAVYIYNRGLSDAEVSTVSLALKAKYGF